MKTKINLLLILIFLSCGKSKSNNSNYLDKSENKQSSTTEHPGKKLLKNQCFVCHNPTISKESRIAPPMVAVKAHYISENTSKEKFTKDFVAFLQKPSKEKAKLKGAVNRFGVMPYQYYKKSHLEKIAEYIYDYEIQEPNWFSDHWKKRNGNSNYNQGKRVINQEKNKTTSEIGLEFVLGTKKVLGKNLMRTIQSQGTLKALEFCNEKAIHLTDSMSTKFNAIIRRVSDKPRNQDNLANKRENEVIEIYKKALIDSLDINPITEKNKDNIQFYYPIITNGMCLQCHGKPKEQIKSDLLLHLDKLYPKDKAKGYKENEIRGIWSISFKE
ncbi:DUF3365 domain-containing protein [uncultured Tenacibaculum sp.]|uniref:Tll0287-like domain-containing protein n=1 Tax=uncultured Tenacibaculum sp. TaxID=174713 RepID=UPI002633C928|nr:DUF3365 domain-containing protein [uncultured Tenacibaculum sp.]